MHEPREIPRVDSERCALAILAGGHSKRMGRDKAGVLFEGERLIDRLLGRLELPGVARFCLGLRAPLTREYRDLEVVPDNRAFAGPLAALAGLEAELGPKVECVFVAAVDMPMLDHRLAATLLAISLNTKPARSVLPVIDGRAQPVAAVWSRACLARANALLREGSKRMLDLIESCSDLVRVEDAEIGVDGELAFFGINAPEDLEALRARLRA